MTKENLATIRTNVDELNGKLLNKTQAMRNARQPYKGTWTEEEFKASIEGYFEWCTENDFEPSKPSLQLWLQCRYETLLEWYKNPKHGFKHEMMVEAFDFMELIYFHKLDGDRKSVV